MAKNQNTMEKRRREHDKRRKAEEKRAKRVDRKDEPGPRRASGLPNSISTARFGRSNKAPPLS